MGWFWGKKDKSVTEPAETKSYTIGLGDVWSEFFRLGLMDGDGATASSALSLYDKSTAVSIPVNFIADCFSSITPVVEKDGKMVTDHPVLDLLNNPSPHYSRELLFEILGKDYLITNEYFLAAIGNVNRPPVELQPISPKFIDIPEGAGGLPAYVGVTGNTLAGMYKPVRRGNRIRYIANNLTEIKQVRGYSTKSNSLLRGQSLLRQASTEVKQHITGNKHNVSLLENGGRLSLIFHFDKDMTKAEFDEAKARVNAQYAGHDNAGRIGVTAGGKLDIKEAGSTNRDMDFVNLQQMAKIAVALQYKFPLPLLTVDASTLDNFKEAKLALFDDATLPLADKVFAGLTNFLMPRFGEDPAKAKITYNINDITALASRRVSELLKRKELNVESDNELRNEMGKEPYEGGDVILKPVNLVPAGTDIMTEIDDPSLTQPQRGSEDGDE